MKKNYLFTVASNFATTLVFVFVLGMVLSACSASEKDLHVMGDPGTVEVPVPYIVTEDRMVNIISNVYYDGKTVIVGDKVAATVDVKHTLPVIEMPSEQHAAATITESNDLEWRDSNGQTTLGTLNIMSGSNYEIFGRLYPSAEYSTLTRVHPKVSVVNTHHTFEGSVNVTIDDDTKSKDFSFDLGRQYFLVDPTVDVKIINTVDTLTQIEVRVDTLVKTIEVHDTLINNVIQHDTITVTNTVIMKDTITVTVDRFIKGADILKSVINDLGYSEGTLMLGNTQLLKIMLRHKEPVINVEKDKLGNVNFTPGFELQWLGDDGQETNGSKDAYNVTVKSFDFIRCEYTKISETMCLVKTIYKVNGSFYNDNQDLCEFEMELAPSYMQKYDEVIIVPETTTYRGIIRKVSVDGLKLMTKPVLQVWNKETASWEDVRTCARVCIGLSGSPSGLDLFVKSRKVVEENEDSHWYTATGNAEMDKQWIGEDTKDDGTVVYRNTKVYDFNFMFTADAINDGKVGPQTQLYVMKADKVTILDPDGKALVCSWEDGSEFNLSTSVKLNDTKYVDDPALVGQTRTESDKLYKYDTTFTQSFTASIGGKELQNVEAKSPLWIPAE